MCSFRVDAPNPRETGDPREFRGQVGKEWGHPCGDGGGEIGRRCGMCSSQSMDWGGWANKIWSVKINKEKKEHVAKEELRKKMIKE